MPLNEEQLGQYLAIMMKYNATLSAEQQEANAKIRADATTEENIEGTRAALTEAFTASDANGDGLLDFDEYKVFAGKVREAVVAKGGAAVEYSADDEQAIFDLFNAATPDTAGVSLQDWRDVAKAAMALAKSMK